MPNDFTARNIHIRVTPKDATDNDLSDNSLIINLNCVDATLENVKSAKDTSGNIILTANIVNRGLDALTNGKVSLIEDSLNGNILESKIISNIEPLTSEIVSFIQPSGIVGNTDKGVYIVVEPVLNETMIGNNSDL